MPPLRTGRRVPARSSGPDGRTVLVAAIVAVTAAPIDGTYRGVVGATEHLVVSRSCVIPMAEFRWRFSRSGGPGGQHANTADTRVEVVFDIAASPSLGPRQRQRLLDKLGPEVRAVASDERSQVRNRALALDRLRDRIAAALRVEKPRTATRPTKSSQQRRIESKRRRSQTKQLRRPVDPGD